MFSTRKRKSEWWQHFDPVADGKVKCHHCGSYIKKLTARRSMMKTHILSCDSYNASEKGDLPHKKIVMKNQPLISDMLGMARDSDRDAAIAFVMTGMPYRVSVGC